MKRKIFLYLTLVTALLTMAEISSADWKIRPGMAEVSQNGHWTTGIARDYAECTQGDECWIFYYEDMPCTDIDELYIETTSTYDFSAPGRWWNWWYYDSGSGSYNTDCDVERWIPWVGGWGSYCSEDSGLVNEDFDPHMAALGYSLGGSHSGYFYAFCDEGV